MIQLKVDDAEETEMVRVLTSLSSRLIRVLRNRFNIIRLQLKLNLNDLKNQWDYEFF